MNTEYVAWFVILVAVGVVVVTYLAVGPVPELPAAEPGDVPGRRAGDAAARPAAGGVTGPPPEAQSRPVSTTEPGPSAPSGTSEIP